MELLTRELVEDKSIGQGELPDLNRQNDQEKQRYDRAHPPGCRSQVVEFKARCVHFTQSSCGRIQRQDALYKNGPEGFPARNQISSVPANRLSKTP